MWSRVRVPVVWVAFLVACGGDPSANTIVGVMVSPPSVSSSVGAASDFTASVQYVDGRQTPAGNARWSVQGSASQIWSSSGRDATVMCIRPSDYFAGGYVGDTIMAAAEVKGQSYIGTASLVSR